MLFPVPPMNLVADMDDDGGAVLDRTAEIGVAKVLSTISGHPFASPAAQRSQVENAAADCDGLAEEGTVLGSDRLLQFSSRVGSTNRTLIESSLKVWVNG